MNRLLSEIVNLVFFRITEKSLLFFPCSLINNVPPLHFYFGQDGKSAPGNFLRENLFAKITFANSELAGIMDHRSSITEAHRAIEQMIGGCRDEILATNRLLS